MGFFFVVYRKRTKDSSKLCSCQAARLTKSTQLVCLSSRLPTQTRCVSYVYDTVYN